MLSDHNTPCHAATAGLQGGMVQVPRALVAGNKAVAQSAPARHSRSDAVFVRWAAPVGGVWLAAHAGWTKQALVQPWCLASLWGSHHERTPKPPPRQQVMVLSRAHQPLLLLLAAGGTPTTPVTSCCATTPPRASCQSCPQSPTRGRARQRCVACWLAGGCGGLTTPAAAVGH